MQPSGDGEKKPTGGCIRPVGFYAWSVRDCFVADGIFFPNDFPGEKPAIRKTQCTKNRCPNPPQVTPGTYCKIRANPATEFSFPLQYGESLREQD